MPEHDLTPEEMLNIARSTMTEERVKAVVHAAVMAAVQESPAAGAARTFLRDVMFPKDMNQVQDTRFKMVVFCSFEQYNEVIQLKARVAELEAELKTLKDDSARA